MTDTELRVKHIERHTGEEAFAISAKVDGRVILDAYSEDFDVLEEMVMAALHVWEANQ